MVKPRQGILWLSLVTNQFILYNTPFRELKQENFSLSLRLVQVPKKHIFKSFEISADYKGQFQKEKSKTIEAFIPFYSFLSKQKGKKERKREK